MRNDDRRVPDCQAYQELLKFWGCSFPQDRGNVKERTMIVEEQGIGFWTRVQLPSGPLKRTAAQQIICWCGSSFSYLFLFCIFYRFWNISIIAFTIATSTFHIRFNGPSSLLPSASWSEISVDSSSSLISSVRRTICTLFGDGFFEEVKEIFSASGSMFRKLFSSSNLSI